MDLHLALLVLGVVLIALIFALSRYSNVIGDFRKKFIENRALQKKEAARRDHDANNAPSFSEAGESEAQFDSPLFEFSDDAQQDHNTLLANEPVGTMQTSSDSSKFQASAQQEEAEATTPLETNEEVLEGPFTSLRQIDYWIKLSPSSPHTQAQIFAHLAQWDQITFPVQLHALTQDNPQWVSLIESKGDTKIMDVVASYQLLNKGHATTLEDLKVFDDLASSLGEAMEADKLRMATPEQAQEQSERLAKFHSDSCEPLEVTINAPKSEAFMGKLVETSAKQQGLEYQEGDYVRMKHMGTKNIVLYRMQSSDLIKFDEDMSSDAKIKGVVFTMLPALSPNPGRDAKEMLDAVKAFASRVKGEIRVSGKPEFHLDQLLNLRNRVSQLERDMAAAGLEPGGPEMHRIFS